MIDLEGALFDLAEHLDHPAGDDLVAKVRERVSETDAIAGATESPQPRDCSSRQRCSWRSLQA